MGIWFLAMADLRGQRLHTEQVKPVSAVRPDVPANLSAVIENMMARHRAQRYQSAQAVAEALAPWAQHRINPPPATEMPQYCLAVSELLQRRRRP